MSELKGFESINKIVKEIIEARFKAENELFFKRPSVWINEKLLYMNRETLNYDLIEGMGVKQAILPKTLFGVEVAGTFKSDITNFMIIEREETQEKTPLSDYSTKELLEEIQRRMEETI